MLDLNGRAAFVSGGSKGIGYASAYRLVAAGARVAICAREEAALGDAAEKLRGDTRGDVVAVPADLGTASGVEAAVDATIDAIGNVDILVNVAGAAPPGRIEDLTDEHWEMAINLKLMGYVRLTRSILPAMKERGFGRIVNVAGNAGKQPDGWLLTAGVVNAAVMALTKAVATDAGRYGVTVNAVCPGPTDTARWAGLQKAYATLHGVDEAEARSAILAHIPTGRVATADDVAHAVAFFAAPESGHLTGVSLMVDGGHVKSV